MRINTKKIKQDKTLKKVTKHIDKKFDEGDKLSKRLSQEGISVTKRWALISIILACVVAGVFYFLDYSPTKIDVEKIKENIFSSPKEELFRDVDEIKMFIEKTNNEQNQIEDLVVVRIKKELSDIRQEAENFKNNSESYYNIALASSILDKFDEALNDYNQAVQENNENIKAWYGLGNVYFYVKDYYLAIKSYENVIKKEPNNILAINNLAYSFLNLNHEENYDKILELFNQVIELDPNNAEAYYGKALLSNRGGDYLKSQELFNKAIELDSNYVIEKESLSNIYNYEGYELCKSGDYSSSLDKFKEAVNIYPNNERALINQCIAISNIIFEEQKKSEDEQEEFRRSFIKLTRLELLENQKKNLCDQVDRSLIYEGKWGLKIKSECLK